MRKNDCSQTQLCVCKGCCTYILREIFESIYKPLDIEEGNWKDIKGN